MSTENQKKELTVLVESIYTSNSFKIFDINSRDSRLIDRSIVGKYFISFGLTTSFSTLCKLEEELKTFENVKSCKLVEIASRKQLMRHLNSVTANEPKQYEITKLGDNILDEKESKDLLEKTNDESLASVIKYLDSTHSWDRHYVNCADGNYKMHHRFVNYQKVGDIEYRIGILIELND